MSNFLQGILVTRSLAPDRVGAFTLAYVTFAFLISASRGTSTDPLTVRYSGAAHDVWTRATASASGTALVNGLIAAIGCFVVGVLLPSNVGHGFIALGIGIPGILVQDSYRLAFFAAGRGSRAFVIDLVWGVLQVGGIAALAMTEHLTVVTSLLTFGGTATVAAGFGFLQSGVAPQPLLARPWLVEHSALAGRYLIENVSGGGARLLRMSLVGWLAGLVAVGSIRAAEILAGPFVVLIYGVAQIAVPEAKHALANGTDHLLKFCMRIGAVQALGALLWAVFAVLVFPLGPGTFLLGANWEAARGLLVPVMLTLILNCFILGASSGLRAVAAARRSLPTQITSDGLHLLGGGLGAMVAGAAGSCWGVAIAAALSTGVWWQQFRRATDEYSSAHRTGRVGPCQQSDEPLA